MNPLIVSVLAAAAILAQVKTEVPDREPNAKPVAIERLGRPAH